MENKDQDIRDADLILIDGKHSLYRGVYAQSKGSPLGVNKKDGTFLMTGAVHYFMTSAVALRKKAKDAAVFVCWEGGKKHRLAIVPEYKGNRRSDARSEEMHEIAQHQLKLLRGLLKTTAWDQVKAPEWEADDAIATIAERAWEMRRNVLIFSGDADLFQCLREGDTWVRQYAVKPNGAHHVYTVRTLKETLGIEPWQVAHMKGLAGDSSDNYKGAPGVGEKYAAKWLAAYKTVEGVIAACESGELTGKKAEAVVEHQEYIRDCFEIAVAQNDLEIEIVHRGLQERARLERALRALRFHVLASDIARLL